MFTDLDKATRWLIPCYYLFGTILPMTLFVLMGFMSGFSNDSSTDEQAEPSIIYTYISWFFLILNPLYTFFMANYGIIIEYFQK
jgi:hypothetical protein